MKYRNPRGQLGRALTILVAQDINEQIMHEDVDAFGAPSECHALVSRGEHQRWRVAYRHACAVSGLKRHEIARVTRAIPTHIWRRLRDQLDLKMNPFRWRTPHDACHNALRSQG